MMIENLFHHHHFISYFTCTPFLNEIFPSKTLSPYGLCSPIAYTFPVFLSRNVSSNDKVLSAENNLFISSPLMF